RDQELDEVCAEGVEIDGEALVFKKLIGASAAETNTGSVAADGHAGSSGVLINGALELELFVQDLGTGFLEFGFQVLVAFGFSNLGFVFLLGSLRFIQISFSGSELAEERADEHPVQDDE